MTWFFVEPEVAGGWGPNTLATKAVGRQTHVTRLHYEFDGWLGDQLLETTPCFIATDTLAQALRDANLTGFQLGEVEISRSQQFLDLHGDRVLPRFVWLKVDPRPFADDFGVTNDLRLVVSQPALNLLKDFGVAHASIEPA